MSEGKQFGSEISAYIYAVLEANEEILKGEAEMSLVKTLMEDPAWVSEFEKLGFGDITREITREKLGIARNMIANGEPVEKIARYTGLPAEEIEGLRNAN